MIVYAKRLGYVYTIAKGSGGEHRTDGFGSKEIVVGKDQSLEVRVITFAHELGHALDFSHEPMSLQEGLNNRAGIITATRVGREEKAWDYGEKLLIDMKCMRHVHERFVEYRISALDGYRRVQVQAQAVNK